jgi:hypothetical protein
MPDGWLVLLVPTVLTLKQPGNVPEVLLVDFVDVRQSFVRFAANSQKRHGLNAVGLRNPELDRMLLNLFAGRHAESRQRFAIIDDGHFTHETTVDSTSRFVGDPLSIGRPLSAPSVRRNDLSIGPSRSIVAWPLNTQDAYHPESRYRRDSEIFQPCPVRFDRERVRCVRPASNAIRSPSGDHSGDP